MSRSNLVIPDQNLILEEMCDKNNLHPLIEFHYEFTKEI